MTRVLLLAVVLCSLSVCLPAEAAPPNIVVFLADDQGWGDLSFTGNTQLSTPNIDSLARDGASLDRFYVCPVCAPTRAEFLTGRYHARGGVRGVSTGLERLNTDEKTLADCLRAAGYSTAAFGKWHNGSQWPYHPNARGFAEYYGFTSGHWGEYFNAPLDHNGQWTRGKGYVTDDFTDHGLAFIEQHREQPFFCYFAYNVPHSPFCVPREDWNRFKDKPITQRGPEGNKEDINVTRAVLAMCENVDHNVGRVLKRLDELKLSDNTIVIYFTDNGPNSFRYNGGMKGRKGSTDEGGVRVPCLVRWPGQIPGGTRVPQICGAIDLLPTLLHVTGVPRVGNKPLDGINLSPLWQNKATEWPDRMIFTHQNGKVSVRTQQYRLDDKGALYDMVADPGQTTNVADKQPQTTARLSAAVASWREEVLAGRGRDDRPYPAGYAEFPRTWLPARDGAAKGQVRRSASAPNCSYFVNWSSPDDRITWDVEINTTGKYQVELLYTCPEADAGSSVELSFSKAKLTGKVAPGWDPPLITDQDVIPRPAAESVMKDFHPLKLGTVTLDKGRGMMTLRATEIPGKSVMDLRGVTLTLLQ